MSFAEEISEAFMSHLTEVENRVNAEACKIIKGKYEAIIKRGIDMFYADYSPRTYRRTRSMYGLFDVKVTPSESGGLDVSVEISEDDMRSGWGSLDGASLFDITYKRGWHGGASSGEGHPSPGTPYWRKPTPFFSHWGVPAMIMGEPPEAIVERALTEFDEVEATLIIAELIDAMW